MTQHLQYQAPWLLVALLLLFVGLEAAAQDEGKRGLWDEEFRRSRPATPAPPASSQPPTPTRAKPQVIPRPAPRDALVGLTVWRLRPDQKRMLRHAAPKPLGEPGKNQTHSEALLIQGDRVRLTIEAGRAGYLYVVSREWYGDGSLGRPHLVFPARDMHRGLNRVAPGRPIDIPAASDNPPYLLLDPSREEYAGEDLMIIVSPVQLGVIADPGEPLPLDPALVRRWETQWRSSVEVLDSAKTVGMPITPVEEQATAQGLSGADPLPQTLLRVRAAADRPLLVTARLRVRPRESH